MGIFQRTGDMISASVSDLLERFEHPVKMLRHALRDMEQSVATVSIAVARSIAAERLLAREQQRHLDQAIYWGEKAAKNVEAGNDELARRRARPKAGAPAAGCGPRSATGRGADIERGLARAGRHVA